MPGQLESVRHVSEHLSGMYPGFTLVTEIQPPRVCVVNDALGEKEKSLLPKDMGRLDSCDKHRNEGDWGWCWCLKQRGRLE